MSATHPVPEAAENERSQGSDELTAQNEFSVTFPCWAILHEKSIQWDEQGKPARFNLPFGVLVVDYAGGVTGIPVFTDSDLASRCHESSNLPTEMRIVALPSSRLLVDFLKAGRGKANIVSFDQPRMLQRMRRAWPLNYAIERLELGEPLLSLSVAALPLGGILPDDELTREWLEEIRQFRAECDAADRADQAGAKETTL